MLMDLLCIAPEFLNEVELSVQFWEEDGDWVGLMADFAKLD